MNKNCKNVIISIEIAAMLYREKTVFRLAFFAKLTEQSMSMLYIPILIENCLSALL